MFWKTQTAATADEKGVLELSGAFSIEKIE
jgi:hypothetical protein